MSKNFWRYFYRIMIMLVLIIVLLLVTGASQHFNVNKNMINSINQPFLFPNSQPKDLEQNYKSCPPNKQDTEACQVYIVCGKDEPACLEQAKAKAKKKQ